MAKVLKRMGDKITAYQIGMGSYMGHALDTERKIVYHDHCIELFLSYDSAIVRVGDFFTIGEDGFPEEPIPHDYFLANHRPVEGYCNTYEKINKEPLLAWETTEPVTPEVKFLMENRGLRLNPGTPEKYFELGLLHPWFTAAADAVLIFYSIMKLSNGSILHIDFDLVTRDKFESEYHYCD